MDVGTDWIGEDGSGNREEFAACRASLTVFNRTRERAEALRKDGAGCRGFCCGSVPRRCGAGPCWPTMRQ